MQNFNLLLKSGLQRLHNIRHGIRVGKRNTGFRGQGGHHAILVTGRDHNGIIGILKAGGNELIAKVATAGGAANVDRNDGQTSFIGGLGKRFYTSDLCIGVNARSAQAFTGAANGKDQRLVVAQIAAVSGIVPILPNKTLTISTSALCPAVLKRTGPSANASVKARGAELEALLEEEAEETAEEETLLCPEPEAPALPDAEAVDSPVEEQPAALTANMTAIARAIAFLFITKTS